MPLLAIPNVSEGRDRARIAEFRASITEAGARVLDVHSDPVHHRSVLTSAGDPDRLVEAMTKLAVACRAIDLRAHEGVHPRLGVLDVCPIVPFEAGMDMAIVTARSVAESIGELGLPVFLYGAAARRDERRSLADLRRGGLEGLIARIEAGSTPDAGPTSVDRRWGVVCLGARGPLIAFNVVARCDPATASEIARTVRRAGLLQVLAFPLAEAAQISMNLPRPDRLGIEDAFALVSQAADERGIEIISTEIVGLPEGRFLPNPDAQVARLLVEPGHSLESALDD